MRVRHRRNRPKSSLVLLQRRRHADAATGLLAGRHDHGILAEFVRAPFCMASFMVFRVKRLEDALAGGTLFKIH